jgi:hypothetical protein
MNILEYEKEEWKGKAIYVVLSVLGVEAVLWIVLASLENDQAFVRSLVATGVGTLAILYLLARLLYRSYLILTGKEWKSSNVAWALAGVRRTKQQDKLKEIALNAPFWGIRREAVEKIIDQAFHKKVVLKDPNREVSIAAWKKITHFDQEFLKEVVLNASHSNLRQMAVEMITDPAFIKDRAINDSDMDVRLMATEKLVESSGDQTLLKDLVSTLADKLKNGPVLEKSLSAGYLQSIYNRHPDNSIRDEIRALNGTTISEGTAPTTGIHTDYDKMEDCANCPCPYPVEHISFYTGGTPGEPPETFYVK